MPRRLTTASASRGGWLRHPPTGSPRCGSATLAYARRISPRAGRGVSPAHPPHSRFKQLVKKVGPEKAEAMLQTAEQGFKENYALLKKLSEM